MKQNLIDYVKDSDAKALAWLFMGIAGQDIYDEENDKKVEELVRLLESEVEVDDETQEIKFHFDDEVRKL